MRLPAYVLVGLFPFAAFADEPWGKADPKAGKALHDKACITCHAQQYGGDGSKMYTRDKRIVHNKLELMQRVATCNTMTRTGWFPEDEAAVAAWLNQQYYHFEK